MTTFPGKQSSDATVKTTTTTTVDRCSQSGQKWPRLIFKQKVEANLSLVHVIKAENIASLGRTKLLNN